jgi:hypothetical protein
MKDHPEFELSDPDRIELIHKKLLLWLKENKIGIFELNRALALELRLQDERRKAEGLERSH